MNATCKTALLALAVHTWSGCLDVADHRAKRDEQVGQATAGGLGVQVVGGLAAVRQIAAAQIHLWAQAPSLNLTLAVPPGVTQVSLLIENTLPDAVLKAMGAGDGLIITPEPRPVATEKAWRLEGLQPGLLMLTLAAPDAAALAPWRFAAFADVQERIDDVQDIYARMNVEPNLRFVVMSGDLTEQGSASQLRRFQAEMKSLNIPIYATLGNHELGTRDELFHEWFGRGNFNFGYRGVRFTFLDSASATLAPAAYGWLEDWLRQGAADVHVVLAHIPPLDPVGTRNGGFASRLEASKLISMLAAGKVDMTIYGHVHTYFAYSNGGIPAYVTGGGGAIPERFDGIGRHFLVIEVDPVKQLSTVALVRVD